MSGGGSAVRRFFDGRVEEWDTARYTDETYRSRGRIALAWLREMGPAKRVLDVGCGTGRQTLGAVAAGDRVVAMDFSYPMAHATRERLRREAPGAPAAVIVADAQHLPFRDGSFDAAIALGVVGFVPDRGRMLDEARRVLAPGGTLVCDAGVPEGRVLFQALSAAASRPLQAAGRWVRRTVLRRPPPPGEPVGWYRRNFAKHAPEELEALLRGAGFVLRARGGAGFGELRLAGVALLPWRVQQWIARGLSAASVLPGGGPLARRALTYLVRAESPAAVRVSAAPPLPVPRPHAPALRSQLRE